MHDLETIKAINAAPHPSNMQRTIDAHLDRGWYVIAIRRAQSLVGFRAYQTEMEAHAELARPPVRGETRRLLLPDNTPLSRTSWDLYDKVAIVLGAVLSFVAVLVLWGLL